MIECEFYTEEQLKPRTQRLDMAYIEEIERKYVKEGEEEQEVGSLESSSEEIQERAENMHSFGDDNVRMSDQTQKDKIKKRHR
jgi:hypothetical protein